MANDLSVISSLTPRHLVVLREKLGIRSPDDLVRADRRKISSAMSRLRPRPDLADISAWQDEARDLLLAKLQPADPGWAQAAAFVISFEQRGDQKQVVVEQAELDPPEPQVVVPGWRLDDAITWMLDRVHPGSGLARMASGAHDAQEVAGRSPVAGSEPGGGPASEGGDSVPEPVASTPPDGEPPSGPLRRTHPRRRRQPALPVLELTQVRFGAGVARGVPLAPGSGLGRVSGRLEVQVAGPEGLAVVVGVRAQPRHAPGYWVARAESSIGTVVRLDLPGPMAERDLMLVVWAPDHAARSAALDLPAG